MICVRRPGRVAAAVALFASLFMGILSGAAHASPGRARGATATLPPDTGDFPRLDFEELEQTIEEALNAGQHTGNYTVSLVPGGDGELGGRECDPQKNQTDLAKTMMLYPSGLLDKVTGIEGGTDFSQLSTPEGKAEVAATVAHEAAHDCYLAGGGPCSPAEELGFPDPCHELAADHMTVDALCKLVREKCADLCQKTADADTPPTPEQQAELDALTEAIRALCKAIRNIRDGWSGENAHQFACLCRAADMPASLGDDGNNEYCGGYTVPPPGDNPPNGDGSYGDGDLEGGACDYPEGYEGSVMPECPECEDCGCELEIDPDPADGGGSDG